MSDKRTGNQSGGMALHDVYFIIFRHKWMILILSTLGFVSAAGIFLFKPPTFQSEADLFIKYVHRETPVVPAGQEAAQLKDLDSGLEGVMGAESAILNSFDLAFQVATNIGPDRILGIPGLPNDTANANAAANRIHEGLTIEHVYRTSVMRITLSHSDPSLVQPLLKELIEDYKTRHIAVHTGNTLTYESMVTEASALHDAMKVTEDDLRRAKNEANVNSVMDQQKEYEDTLGKFKQAIVMETAELAEHKAKLTKLNPTDPMVTGISTNSATTNAVKAPVKIAANTNRQEVPKEKIQQYQDTLDLLAALNKQRIEKLQTYYVTSGPVVELDAQIGDLKKTKLKLEQDEPRLLELNNASSNNMETLPTEGFADKAVRAEELEVDGIQTRLQVLEASYNETYNASTNLNAKAFGIEELESKLKNQRDRYDSWEKALQEMTIDTAIGASKDANISVIQTPKPPTRERAKTPKMMAIVAVSGVGLGLAWAFLFELYIDHSVKRAKDVETDLGLRLFLTIPDMGRKARNGKRKPPVKGSEKAKDAPDGSGLLPVETTNGNGNGHVEVAPWDENHALHQHYEALRDKLITYFEVNNLNHKPKLVAVSGAGHGSGTSTLAAGLAASLSETGDGNVLLIDMNLEQGAAQQFFHGKPHCELDAALANNTMSSAMIQDNLYIVQGRTNGDKLSSMLPKRFANLIPRLKASDYDYIIFDMPPISRTGVTQRLAGFMDMTMLVVEAEKTNRDVVRQANTMLTESKAKVSVVLNKTRTYIPRRLHQEF